MVTETSADSSAPIPPKPAADDAPEAIAELRGVHKAFGEQKILRGLNLRVQPGETIVVIGRSGTGKSVTIKHIVGLIRPDDGDIFVFGKNLWSLSPKERKSMRLRIGYLFQSGALLNWMTLGENIALPLLEHRRHLQDEERHAIVLEKLRLVNMESAWKKLPSEISGGMKKRAALARAIVLDPEIVLYDEPTSGLDPVISNTINELILETQSATGATQIVVTHDMESAYRIADRIAMLYDGKLIAIGTSEEIRSSTDPIVQQFIHGRTTGPLDKDA